MNLPLRERGLPHIGGYGSFEYDITDALTAGDNLITVSCYDNTRSPMQAGGKQSPRFASYRCYYTRTTGIRQTVWYEIVPESYIKYAAITPDLYNCSVSVNATLYAIIQVIFCGFSVSQLIIQFGEGFPLCL